MFRPLTSKETRYHRRGSAQTARHLQARRLCRQRRRWLPVRHSVNYFFDAEHDKIYFHGAKAGHKVDALKRDDKVCFYRIRQRVVPGR